MATLNFDRDTICGVDRDGYSRNYPQSMNQGFNIDIDGVRLHFDDEEDAVKMAKAILLRMGQWEEEPKAKDAQ